MILHAPNCSVPDFCTNAGFEDLNLFQHDGGPKAQFKHVVNFIFAFGRLISEKNGCTELSKLPPAEPSPEAKSMHTSETYTFSRTPARVLSNQHLPVGSGFYIHFREPCHIPHSCNPPTPTSTQASFRPSARSRVSDFVAVCCVTVWHVQNNSVTLIY